MSTDAQTLDLPPSASRKPSLPRFPSQWFVGEDSTERSFGRLLWLLVPLQYYVVTHVAHGLAEDDFLPSVALSLLSVAFIFILSCVIAWLASVTRWKDRQLEESLTGHVRMWVVALMINTATGYLLLTSSLAATYVARNRFEYRIYGDIVTDTFTSLLEQLGFAYHTIDLIVPVPVNMAYSFMALLLIVFAHRRLGNGAAMSPPREPGLISVGVIAAVVMTAANLVATFV